MKCSMSSMNCSMGSMKCGSFHDKKNFSVEVEKTGQHCPAGETRGRGNIKSNAIPVLSCEGACIRGEIARTAANILSKEKGYARGCHGELLTVPDSAIAKWIKGADQVVVIDGCFLKCHERIFKNILDESKIRSFDALSYYNRYTEHFDIDAVPASERRKTAEEVAAKILSDLESGREGTGSGECGAGRKMEG